VRVNYRKFGRKDLPAAHRLSVDVNWPHRLQDWEFVQRLGTGYVAEDGDGIVGTVLCWKHDRRSASLGMVIVAPDRQGRGIGRKLMTLALADLEGRAVLLNATRAGQPLYEGLGFKAIDAVEQHQGSATRVPVASLAHGERLRPMGASDGPKLAALATRASGLSRRRVITKLLDVAEGIVLSRGGEPIGFALFRRFGRGHAIGPVVAPDAPRARVLIGHWAAMHPGEFLRIDVHASTGLGAWLDGIGLKKVETVVTMMKGAPPPRDARVRAFALVNQALG
jgi:GNAT superfamily N-acetyltransferase